RSGGFATRLLARGIDAASLAIYHATREGGDPAERRSGHRLVTHTIPGCLLASLVVASLCLLHPAAGGVVACLLARLLCLGLRKAGGGVALAAGGVAVWVLTQHFAWWWVLPVASFLGCLVHILGDTVTNSGTPLLWPLARGGRRWRLLTTPWTFGAGGAFELVIVAPCLLVCCLLASLGWAAVALLPLVQGGV